MRKSLILIFTLLLCVSAFAQQRTGNITGKVADLEGNTLPGVTVTLINPFGAAMTSVTSAEGVFRFLSLPPSRNYGVRLELTGFKTKIEEGIIVTVGSTTNMNFVLEIGVLEEQVTVTAVSPMVDTKKTAVGINVTQDVLQGLPTARDPWVILQMAPSIIVDRENVGGAESGQQSNYVARGANTYNQNVWAMDGVVITDPAAIGASPSYYDFDAFEEMQITVGGADVTVQTGGIALNMVTRRAGNKLSLGGRFYMTEEKFQADNLTEEFKKEGVLGINKINVIRDYGFNLGLPLIKDRAWIWGSYGIQDIKTRTIYGGPDDTLLTNYVAKLNLQIIPQNRFEAFVHVGGKIKWGRSSTAANPEGEYQSGRYHFGSPIIKIQDEHMFGDSLFISLKYAFSDAGFSLTPMTDLDFNKLALWDEKLQRWYGSQARRYYVERPVNQYNFLANYFNDSLLGASHDVKIGFEYADRAQYVESTRPGNLRVYQNYNSPQIDLNGDRAADIPPSTWKYVAIDRGYFRDAGIEALAGYFSDTVSFGKFNLILGLRLDYQTPRVNDISVTAVEPDSKVWKDYATAAAISKLDGLLPGVPVPAVAATAADGSKYGWLRWSPRLGLTWDVLGDGKTIVKASVAQYGEFMGTAEANRYVPGGTSGLLRFWWLDTGDGKMDISELYWLYRRNAALVYSPYKVFDAAGNFVGNWADASGFYWSGFDYANPVKLTNPYQIVDKNAQDSRTSEALLTIERELFTDFAVSLNFSYRKYDQYRWTLKYFQDASGNLKDIDNSSWYVSAGAPPANIPGIGDTKDVKNQEWYYRTTAATAYSPYEWVKKRPDYYLDYFGVDFIFNKRLSNKWMMNGSFTWQDQAIHYGNKGYINPTNVWAYEGQPQAAYIGGASGKIDQYTYSRWLFKIGGLYQLPFGTSVAMTFQAREGWIQREYFRFYDYTLPNPAYVSDYLDMTPFGSGKLPNFYNLTLRAEKMLKLGDTGRIYIMADLFNVLNSPLENRRYQKYYGTYYYYGAGSSKNTFVADPNFNALNEILNPRVLRLGVRFQF